MATRALPPIQSRELAAFFVKPPKPRMLARPVEPPRGVLAELARYGRPQ